MTSSSTPARRYSLDLLEFQSRVRRGSPESFPRRETPTRFEYDSDAWNRLPVEQRPAGFHPIHGVSEDFSIDGGQRSIYGLSELIADAACQEYAQAYDLPVVVNRFGVLSGAGESG